MKLAEYVNWNGTADQLVAVATRLAASDPIFQGQPAPNVRLVRDYVQRKIVDVPERRGREAIYSYRHLLQFLAAKALVADNWPLRKIAEALPHMGEDRLAALIGGEVAGARVKTLSDAENPATGGLVAGMITQAPFGFEEKSNGASSDIDTLHQRFKDHAEDIMQKRSDLRAFSQTFMLGADPPAPEEWTGFQITEWMTLLVETDELKALSFGDADWIGRAVTSMLYRYMTEERG
ncbi:hypothetical protein ACLB6G_20590 [Zhengella sp. ZM62]|uniref:hypothetical protein n=1 Tax=Zhengella sedimenti TaxID=3390035 RepID=UPI0039763292